jgi:hypothetical protein
MHGRQVLYHLSHASSPFALVISQIGALLSGVAPNPDPSSHASLLAGITGVYPTLGLFFEVGVANFLCGLALNYGPPLSASQVSGITGMSLSTQIFIYLFCGGIGVLT